MAKKLKPPKPPKFDGIIVTRETTAEGVIYCADKNGRQCFDTTARQRVVLTEDLRRYAPGLSPGQVGWTVPDAAVDPYKWALVQFDNGEELEVLGFGLMVVKPAAAKRISAEIVVSHRNTAGDEDPLIAEKCRREAILKSCADVVDFGQVQEGGEGAEEVYAFTFGSLRRLAELEHRPHYPMKVGYTADRDYGAALRVRGLVMEKAGYPERVQLLLVWRTPNGRGLETAIHRWLKAEGRRMKEAMSREWFSTNAAEVFGLCQALPPVPVRQLPALKPPNQGPIIISVQPDGTMRSEGVDEEEQE